MGFVQIVQFDTSRLSEMEAVGQEWEKATEGKRLARRRILCQDRDVPGRYYNVVFFDSYEEAMKNSQLPETQDLSQKMMGLADGPGTFYNLDIVEDRDI